MEKTEELKLPSTILAEVSGRRHGNLIRAIEQAEVKWKEIIGEEFTQGTYRDCRNKPCRCYMLTEPQMLFVSQLFNRDVVLHIILRWKEHKEASHYNTAYAENVASASKSTDFHAEDKDNEATNPILQVLAQNVIDLREEIRGMRRKVARIEEGEFR